MWSKPRDYVPYMAEPKSKEIDHGGELVDSHNF